MRRFFIISTLLVVLSSVSFAQTEELMGAIQNDAKAFFLSGIDAFNAHDLDDLVAQFFGDFEMYTPQGWFRGLPSIRERFDQIFRQNPSVKMEIENLQVRAFTPEAVAIDFNWMVYPSGSGPAYRGVTTGVYVLRDGEWGEVLEHESVISVDETLRQSDN